MIHVKDFRPQENKKKLTILKKNNFKKKTCFFLIQVPKAIASFCRNLMFRLEYPTN